MNPLIQLQTKPAQLLIAFALACFALSPAARAVDPPPDGGYPDQNTAEGDYALFDLDTSQGANNTAIGFSALYFNTTGDSNTATGAGALANNTPGFCNTANGASALGFNITGSSNTATGCEALYSNQVDNNTATGFEALFSNTIGTQNTANGVGALFTNSSGSYNTATGLSALRQNTEGSNNTANGINALYSNTTGFDNAATGSNALLSNTTGYWNTATGINALYSNTTGFDNTANGAFALQLNTTGFYNTANGVYALYSNTTGYYNAANAAYSLFSNTTGFNNTANGAEALYGNTTGDNNMANGVDALLNNTSGHDNTAEGFSALQNNTTGSSNIAIGSSAGFNLTTGSNNIDIGNAGLAGESNKIRIGTKGTQTTTFIAGISGTTVSDGVGVIVGTNGKLGTVVSSARFKDEIRPMDKASEAILALKPVTFRYKKELDPDGLPQFGLVAEEVEKVNRDLVARDDQGKPYTVRYDAVNVMLLNEFLKEHRKVEEQDQRIQKEEATIAQLKAALAKHETVDAEQQDQLEALTAGLQRVSAQVEMSRPAPQMVNNHK